MIHRRTVLLLPLIAAGCGDDEPAQQSFPLPSYGYLTPLRLSVGSIQFSDRTPPVPPDTIAAIAPLRPVDALKQMGTDRLIASGVTGHADYVIDQAVLRRIPGGIEGVFAVHLDVYAGAGSDRSGYAEARVARRRTSNNSGENPRTVLYSFVKQMMDDMNVEFEYQIKRSLKDWLQQTSGAAPPPPQVESQPLAAPVAPTALPPGVLPLRRPGS